MYKVGKTLNYVDWAPKACIKRCVFNLRLKVSMSEIALICDGRKFHWRLPATAKARSPNCSLVAGINKSVDDDDLSDVRDGMLDNGVKSSVRYDGAVCESDLCTSRQIL